MSCSTQAPVEGEEKEETRMPSKTIDSYVCARCKEQKGVLVVVHTSYCRGCLTYILRGRFARSVAPFLPALAATKNGSPKPKPSWLLASSGGSASAAMIDMFHQSMCTEDDGPKGRHRWSRLVVGWVDFGEEEEDRKAARVEAMKRSAVLHGFEFWRVSVDEAFDEEGALLDPLEDKGTRGDIGSIGIKVHPGRVLHNSSLKKSTSAEVSPYRALLAHLPSTSHPALRAHILHSLLTRMALSLDTNNPSTISTPSHPPYLLLGPTSTRVASLTIASLAAGRGYALPLLVAPSLEYRGVRMIRPLTSTGKKEMVWYARMRGLEVVDWDWESGARSVETGKPTSIEALTQDFVQTLNTTHPSTVSTISRTSHKLLFPGFIRPDGKLLADKHKKELWSTGRVCPLCELPSDEAPLDWLSKTSITSLPSPLPPSSASPLPTDSIPSSSIPIERSLCYACLTTLVSPSAFSASRPPEEDDAAHVRLPAWTLDNLVRETVKGREDGKVERKDVSGWMKAEGWLLSDNDDEDENENL